MTPASSKVLFHRLCVAWCEQRAWHLGGGGINCRPPPPRPPLLSWGASSWPVCTLWGSRATGVLPVSRRCDFTRRRRRRRCPQRPQTTRHARSCWSSWPTRSSARPSHRHPPSRAASTAADEGGGAPPLPPHLARCRSRPRARAATPPAAETRAVATVRRPAPPLRSDSSPLPCRAPRSSAGLPSGRWRWWR